MLTVSFRKGHNKEEKKLFGQTKLDGSIAQVYINMDKGRSGEPLNTFFHEMVHVWLDMFSNQRFSPGKEEELARQIGSAAEAIITLH